MFKYKDRPDLKESQLPHNRFELFFDIIKNRIKFILANNLLLFAFSLPLFLGIIYISYEKANYISTFIESDSFSFNSLFGYNLFLLGALIIGLLILSVALSGLIEMIQEIIFREGVVYSTDFIKGIKNNYVRLLISSILISFSVFSFISSIDYMRYVDNSFVGISFLIISVILILFSSIFSLFFIAQNLQYNVKMMDGIRNALILFFAFFPRNILFFIATVVPIILVNYFGFISSVIYFLVLGFILYIPLIIASILYSNYIFDLSINKRIEGGIVRRGLSKDE